MILGASWKQLPGLSPDDQVWLLQAGHAVDFAPGATLVAQGVRPDGLLLLLSGAARVELGRPDDRGTQVALVRPGELIGELSYVTGSAASASVVAVDACQALHWPQAELARLAGQDPGFATRLYKALAQVLAARLRKTIGRLATAPDTRAAVDHAGADILAALQNVRHSPLVESLIGRYETVGHRNRFIWRWAAYALDITRLPTVRPGWQARVHDIKMLAVILNVLIDDLADERGSAELLECALAIPFTPGGRTAPLPAVPADDRPLPAVPADDRPLFALIAEVWHTMVELGETLPNWTRYRELLLFDYRQILNSMRYGLLVKSVPALLNTVEHGLYQPASINMMAFVTIDLMASPRLDDRELSLLREAIWYAQSMAEISNMLATWRRELPARDFTSRVFVLALWQGVVTAQELAERPVEELAARLDAAGVEDSLLEEWHTLRARLQTLAPRLQTVPIAELVKSMEITLGVYLAARDVL